ncbi:fibrinogen C domain-containing protein 1-like [Aplysia californica]|uniref:Fibrinogen C domain-containing protein 1-like n=1 Tax=Aplysia californica TaxID=6500 RepID=A0ABM0ZYT2_APLCA|nr:fibrinogen C domain-containing protein 1-like [Aplysia californica]
MDATWTFTKLILAAALVTPSKAWRLNVTSEEIDVGKTAHVSLSCFNPYQQQDISEILMMRIQKKQPNGWHSVGELRDGDVDVRLTARDATATGSIVAGANSFMRLTWPLATNDTIGQYRCDVTFVNSHGSVGWQKGLPASITRKSDVTVQILSDMVEENKKQCMQQIQDIQEYMAAAIQENKRQCQKEKQDVFQNQAAILKAVEILENVAFTLDRNKREVLQHSQDLLVNATTIMEAIEASFERKLSIVKSQLRPQSCANAKGLGPRPVVLLSSGQLVVCDMVTDQGGWIVIQRRASADVDFHRGWADYRNGFGDLSGNNNFWLGLEKIYLLTRQGKCELRFDFTFEGKNYYANYDNFELSGESSKYRIEISGFSGNVSDSMAYHNGQPFSTKNRDNDSWGKNCASVFYGGWWFRSCHHVNFNGLWASSASTGLRWLGVTSGSVSFSEMKIRPFAK